MTKRKKRLQKGVVSLGKQITLHGEKLHKAEAQNKIELAGYYRKEISAKKRDLEKKEKLLEKQ